MTDQDRQVGVIHLLVHHHPVAHVIPAQVDQVLPVLWIMVDDLPSGHEGWKDLLSKDLPEFLMSVLAVQANGAD